jgi:hypothetical protein
MSNISILTNSENNKVINSFATITVHPFHSKTTIATILKPPSPGLLASSISLIKMKSLKKIVTSRNV